MTPRFFIIGAPKCGTTTLAHWLSQTDSVFMTDPKEPHFYASDYSQTWTSFSQHKDDYEALFSGVTDQHCAAGEGSTHYLWSSDAIDNILQDYPAAKFIVCLRNPVDMARSMHGHSVYWGNETISDFKAAWEAQADRRQGRNLPPWNPNPGNLIYQDLCATGTQVTILLDKVPSDRVKFVFIEDLSGDPAGTYRDVISFLGATESPISFEKKNVTRDRKNVRFNNAIRSFKYHARGRILRKIAEIAGDLNDRLNTKPAKIVPISNEFRAYLIEIFRPEVDKLEMATGRDLSSWRVL